MRIKCFAIPALTSEVACEEVSNFLASHRILTVDREFVVSGPTSYWAVCVTYQQSTTTRSSKSAQVDYREILSTQDFAVFARLRTLRNQLASRDGVPAYAVFNNEQIASMARERVSSNQQLLALPGVGASKVTKYGELMLALLRQLATPEPEPNPSQADATP